MTALRRPGVATPTRSASLNLASLRATLRYVVIVAGDLPPSASNVRCCSTSMETWVSRPICPDIPGVWRWARASRPGRDRRLAAEAQPGLAAMALSLARLMDDPNARCQQAAAAKA